MLAERYQPLCSLSVAGKPFGSLYEQIDHSRHFKFNVTMNPSGTRAVDIALTGKNSMQNVLLEQGRRDEERVRQWKKALKIVVPGSSGGTSSTAAPTN